MKHLLKILSVLILLAFVSCGGGSGSGSNYWDSAYGDGTLEDMGDTISEALPGTIFYYTGTDTYDTYIQVGSAVVVADSITVAEGYEIENTLIVEEIN